MTVTISFPYATKKRYCKQEIIGFQHPREEEAMHLNCNKEVGYQQNVLLVRTVRMGLGYLGSLWHLQLGSSPRQGTEHPDFLGHCCQCQVGVLPQFEGKCQVQDKDKFSAITLW